MHLQISHRDEKTVYQAVILDQTENVKLQKELLHALKLSAIGELAAGVGHEINNPLTVISGNLEKIRKKLIATQDDNLNSSIEKYLYPLTELKLL